MSEAERPSGVDCVSGTRRAAFRVSDWERHAEISTSIQHHCTEPTKGDSRENNAGKQSREPERGGHVLAGGVGAADPSHSRYRFPGAKFRTAWGRWGNP